MERLIQKLEHPYQENESGKREKLQKRAREIKEMSSVCVEQAARTTLKDSRESEITSRSFKGKLAITIFAAALALSAAEKAQAQSGYSYYYPGESKGQIIREGTEAGADIATSQYEKGYEQKAQENTLRLQSRAELDTLKKIANIYPGTKAEEIVLKILDLKTELNNKIGQITQNFETQGENIRKEKNKKERKILLEDLEISFNTEIDILLKHYKKLIGDQYAELNKIKELKPILDALEERQQKIKQEEEHRVQENKQKARQIKETGKQVFRHFVGNR